ncbi:hypothetical protein CHELA1G11_10605 [Hyphomicrobiales bacterium]|nr:hypothetical protein CHELA1G11_10605 [Hyphomicrobiales bacterium]CAH1673499.1 hypothetical protein CHELA1G2_13698 [Hyphomicrobiales bacterium]
MGFDALVILGDRAFHPGEERRVGFYFLSADEAADSLKKAGRFFLWEGRTIGEAQVVV